MWDDQHEKQMMRNQMVAIILITGLLLMWYQFYAPQPQVQPPPATEPAPQTAPADLANASEAPIPDAQAAAPLEESEDPSGDQWPFLPPVPVQDDPAADDEHIFGSGLFQTIDELGD